MAGQPLWCRRDKSQKKSLIGHLNKPVKDVPDPLHKRGEMDRGSPESIPLWYTDSQGNVPLFRACSGLGESSGAVGRREACCTRRQDRRRVRKGQCGQVGRLHIPVKVSAVCPAVPAWVSTGRADICAVLTYHVPDTL